MIKTLKANRSKDGWIIEVKEIHVGSKSFLNELLKKHELKVRKDFSDDRKLYAE